ncbi:MAG: PH domain-containing protein [Acidobacteriota bacterium]
MTAWQARYDRTTKRISALVCLLLAVVALATQSLIAGGLATVMVLLAWAYSPRGYLLAGPHLIVRRLAGNVKIPMADLREVRPAREEDLRGAIRLWGSGGMFGYYGLFSTSRLGNCTWYVTDRSKVVLVLTDTKTFALSPDDTGSFVAAVHTAMPAGAPDESPVSPPRTASRAPLRSLRAAGLALAALALVLVGLALSWSPGPPACTLAAGTLAIHDRFYPVTLKAADLDLEQVRIVDVTGQSEWRPTARTNGFANAHYHAGWFQVANGKTVRLYRADATRLVLLPAKGNGPPVLLEVQDPEAFMRRLRGLAD